ncbi:MAG: hypothetical protein ABW106_16515 [Steroidobacteraceae bacterium]
MLSYDTLDAIADSVNPTLGVVALLAPWLRRPSTTGRVRYALALDALTLLAVAAAYAGQAIDKQLGLWPAAGLDFSTHTAIFVAIASSLWQAGQVWRVAAASLGLAYAMLMVYQRYHSWLDITTTTAAMLPPLILLWWWAMRLLASKERLSQPRPRMS